MTCAKARSFLCWNNSLERPRSARLRSPHPPRRNLRQQSKFYFAANPSHRPLAPTQRRKSSRLGRLSDRCAKTHREMSAQITASGLPVLDLVGASLNNPAPIPFPRLVNHDASRSFATASKTFWWKTFPTHRRLTMSLSGLCSRSSVAVPKPPVFIKKASSRKWPIIPRTSESLDVMAHHGPVPTIREVNPSSANTRRSAIPRGIVVESIAPLQFRMANVLPMARRDGHAKPSSPAGLGRAVPANVTIDHASSLPSNIPLNAVRIANITWGDRVVVIGLASSANFRSTGALEAQSSLPLTFEPTESTSQRSRRTEPISGPLKETSLRSQMERCDCVIIAPPPNHPFLINGCRRFRDGRMLFSALRNELSLE